MKKVAFYDNAFSFRGTTQAILKYSKYLQDTFDCETSVLFDAGSPYNSKKFIRENISNHSIYPLIDPFNSDSLKDLAGSFDALYIVSLATQHHHLRLINELGIPILFHQIGYEPPVMMAGNGTALYCSYWQSYYFSLGLSPVLPYIVREKINIDQKAIQLWRSELGIPNNSIVLGRHGGYDTWNLKFACDSVIHALDKRSDLYFVFVNTPRFTDHRNVIFLKPILDDKNLALYLNSCDAMLHARWEGETFGLACAEFMIYRKPIITWSGCRERSHIYMAERSIITYNNYDDLSLILTNITFQYLSDKSAMVPDIASQYGFSRSGEMLKSYLNNIL